jgi:hypothetical protein
MRGGKNRFPSAQRAEYAEEKNENSMCYSTLDTIMMQDIYTIKSDVI